MPTLKDLSAETRQHCCRLRAGFTEDLKAVDPHMLNQFRDKLLNYGTGEVRHQIVCSRAALAAPELAEAQGHPRLGRSTTLVSLNAFSHEQRRIDPLYNV